MFHAEEYVNRILETKPAIIKDNYFLNNLYDSMDELTIKDRKTFKVVHISDPHVDFEYTPGSDAFCNDYLCCREKHGFPTEKERQAGEWGSYQCDLPPKTLESMFQYIADVIQPDLLIWTGDNSPHSIWENDLEEVIMATTNVTNMIRKTLGDKVPVIAIQGNHDSFPSNNQDFSKNNTYAVLKNYSQIWQEAGWLDSKEAAEYERYGYYSKTLKIKGGKVYSNSRIIAINTLSCYYFNFDGLLTRYDPGQ